ncbi:MAG: membrane protein insertion efficiency factor YidD [Bacilli bacterium]|nr:membrane protein insertion efficiency factor YidD [Bacilli bacterium]
MHKHKNELVVKLIRAYQKNKGIIGIGHCKFYPTCSNYALETYKKFNFFYASILVGIRLLRCNAFAKRRYYPVKLTKKEKQIKNYLNSLKDYLNDDFIDYLQSFNDIDITPEDLYLAIYDYYYLPTNVHFNINYPTNMVYTNRFIVTDKPINIVNKPKNLRPFEEYLKIVDELYALNLIKTRPKETSLDTTYDYLIPIDSISINQHLELLDINEGFVLINNFNEEINYKDFKVINFTTNKLKDFKELIKDETKLIILTNNINIFEYLEYLTYSINIYDDIKDINYFYDLNKRKANS